MIFEIIKISVLIILGLFFLMAFLMFSPSRRAWHQPWLKVHFAHRGFYNQNQGFPENSLGAYQNAVDHHFGIELDVQCSHDGLVYVFHDEDCLRMTGISGLLEEKNRTELDLLRLQASQEKIPLLKDVLEMVNGQSPIFIELKTTLRRKLCVKQVLEDLKNYQGNITLCSFDPLILLEIKKQAPDRLRGLNIEPAIKKSKYNLITGLALHYGLLNFLIKPDYISVDYRFNSLCYWLNHNLGIYGMMWAISSQEIEDEKKTHCETIIFKGYNPR